MIERRPLKQTNGSTAAAEATVTADSPLPDRLRELERRIGAALGSFVPQVQNSPDAESASGEPTAAALGDLLAQLDRAVIAAAEHARAEHEKSLDPLAFPDAREARQSAEDAAFMANRLRTLQPRLLDAYTRTVERERSPPIWPSAPNSLPNVIGWSRNSPPDFQSSAASCSNCLDASVTFRTAPGSRSPIRRAASPCSSLFKAQRCSTR
jgi:hypothetical protein